MKYLLYAVAPTLFANVADSVAEEDTAELAAKLVAKLHYDNGHTFLDDKDYTSAGQEFDRALISFPEYPLVYLSRAQARYLKQEYDSAIEDANDAALFQKTRRSGLAYAAGSPGHQYVLAL